MLWTSMLLSTILVWTVAAQKMDMLTVGSSSKDSADKKTRSGDMLCTLHEGPDPSLQKSRRNQCSLEESHRIDCGYIGITGNECLSRGCCWTPCEDCTKSTPWCYLAAGMLAERCAVPAEEKDDCGFWGIKQSQCLMRGCCWVPSNRPNEPWCFRAKETPVHETSTFIPPEVTTEVGNEGDVRLADGDGITSGRVEIYHAGLWGTVCDDNFDTSAANVVCHQLGLEEGLVMPEAYFGPGQGPIWMDAFSCDGTETNLMSCPIDGTFGDHDCSHAEDASVICAIAEDTGEGDLLLADGSKHSGRLEVRHNGEWGTVCDDGFGHVEAKVACWQMGFGSGQIEDPGTFAAGTGQLWLDGITCSGSESRLVDCAHNVWGTNDCAHDEDIAISCEGDYDTVTDTSVIDVEVRLFNGSSANTGLVQVLYNDAWGTVCDDNFEENEALVVCQQLGYVEGMVMYRDVAFGHLDNDTPIWLDKVDCTGDETNIGQCGHLAWGNHDCDHYEDVAVLCSGGEQEAFDSIAKIAHFLATSPLLFDLTPPSEAQQQMNYQVNSEDFALGYNLSTPEGIHQLYNRLKDIHTIDDIIEFVSLPSDIAKLWFEALQKKYRELGGLDGIDKALSFAQFLDGMLSSSIPDLPLKSSGGYIARDMILRILEGQRIEYEEYLPRFRFLIYGPYPPPFLTLNTAELADILAGHTTREELATGFGWDIRYIDSMAEHKEYYHEALSFLGACGYVAKEIVKFGIMDIEVN